MLIGFAGVAMLVTPRGAGSAFDRRFVIGALAIQLGCIAWQYGTMRGKYALASIPPLMSSALQMLAGGFVVTLAGVALGEAAALPLTPRTFAALAYLVALRLRARLHVVRLRRAPPAHDEHVALRLRQPGRRRDPRLARAARAADLGLDRGDGRSSSAA